MEYNVSDIVREVKVALDENVSSTSIANTGDVDTLKLDEIVSSKIVDAARIVESQAPSYLLGSGKAFGQVIGWDSQPGYGSGHMQLPDDFLRLVTFQMSDWEQAITEPILETDPLYAQQRSRFSGVRGTPQRPVVAIVTQPIGNVLEFYCTYAGDEAYVKRARYISIPRIRNNQIDLCEKLKPAIVYYTAYLAALSLGDGTLASVLLNSARDLADMPSE